MNRRERLLARIAQRKQKIDDLLALVDAEQRDLNEAEQAEFDSLVASVKADQAAIVKLDEIEDDPELPSAGVRSKPPGSPPAPNIGTSKADQKPYSISRAIQSVILNKPLEGREAEVDQEVQRRAKSSMSSRTFKGFAIPSTLNDPDIRALMFPNISAEAWERRDLTTTTGVGSIYTTPRGFIELLRVGLLARRLGIDFMEDMQGNFAMTRQNGTNVVQWVGEGASATPTNLSFDNVLFSPKLAIATTIYSKQFAMQTSISVDDKINKDLAAVMSREFDRVIFNGSGGTQPLGILNNSTIQTLSVAAGLPIGTNGGPMTYAKAIAMEGAIATANAEAGKIAYVTNFNVRSQLKLTNVQAPGQTSASFIPVWGKGASPDEGEVNNQRAFAVSGLFMVTPPGGSATNYSPLPNTLTKGTAVGVCSPIVYGNWGDYTVATWDTGVDVIVDPFTGKRSGAIEITTEMAMDAHPMHEASFVVILDVTTP